MIGMMVDWRLPLDFFFGSTNSREDVECAGERHRSARLLHRLGMGGSDRRNHVHLRSERSARLGRFRVHVQSQEWPSD